MESMYGLYDEKVNLATTDHSMLKRLLLLACKINSISPIVIDRYIPRRYGLRNTFAFRCLLHINISPGMTKTAYSKSFNTCQQATCHAIDYLNALGLIREMGKPRLLIPFQKYTVDKAYKITPKGIKVIKDVFDKADIEY